MRLVIFGPQASGKGTQADLIAEKYGVAHISTGDMLRQMTKQDTSLGKEIKRVMDAGILVSDDLNIKIVEERIKRSDCIKGFILDGFPRNLTQAKMFEVFSGFELALLLDIPDELAVKRLSSRWTCRKCGAIYGAANPSKKTGVCDRCGGELYQRADDNPESIRKRLTFYHKETKPVEDYYDRKGILVRVDGTRSVDEIFDEIKHIIENAGIV